MQDDKYFHLDVGRFPKATPPQEDLEAGARALAKGFEDKLTSANAAQYRGDWTASVTYNEGDVVYKDGALYAVIPYWKRIGRKVAQSAIELPLVATIVAALGIKLYQERNTNVSRRRLFGLRD